jgi:putative NADH-flavin reductase
MKIAVFGATGGLGQQFLSKALAKGHEIVAYVRSPEKIIYEHESLKVIVGDVFDKQKIVEIMKGLDAVFITWRMRSQHIPLFSEGTQNVVDAMKEHGIKRIIVMSEYAYGEHYRNFGLLMRSLTKLYEKFGRFQIRERKAQEALIYSSGLDWTINRVRGMNDDEEKNEFELTFEPKSKFKVVYRGHAAEKVLHEFENPDDYIGKNVYF